MYGEGDRKLSKIELAKTVMEKAHRGQTRRDGETPYSVHPIKVVETLQYFKITDDDILSAGYLHDVLEDTDYSKDTIKEQFGERVLSLVEELTFKGDSHDDDLYWSQVEQLSNDAKWIKLADILSNLGDVGKKSEHFVYKRTVALRIIMRSIK